MVLITDGRANVSLAKSNEDPAALEPDAPKPTQDELKVRGRGEGHESSRGAWPRPSCERGRGRAGGEEGGGSSETTAVW